jgi:hypothetical protein
VIEARKMTKEEMREWISGKKKVYLCGTVRYRDAFNSQCFTNFCYSVIYWQKRCDSQFGTTQIDTRKAIRSPQPGAFLLRPAIIAFPHRRSRHV